MKVISYQQAKSQHFDSDLAKGVTGRVVIGKADGASNFCMRVFELAPEGFSPRHAHSWEHEIFFHAGNGEIYHDGRWLSVQAGSVAYIPGNEEHQIRNTGSARLVFVCLIPKEAPEM
jgi:quercetin dioxygenase-like cupin family protein